jgi:hypothetical protein
LGLEFWVSRLQSHNTQLCGFCGSILGNIGVGVEFGQNRAPFGPELPKSVQFKFGWPLPEQTAKRSSQPAEEAV